MNYDHRAQRSSAKIGPNLPLNLFGNASAFVIGLPSSIERMSSGGSEIKIPDFFFHFGNEARLIPFKSFFTDFWRLRTDWSIARSFRSDWKSLAERIDLSCLTSKIHSETEKTETQWRIRRWKKF